MAVTSDTFTDGSDPVVPLLAFFEQAATANNTITQIPLIKYKVNHCGGMSNTTFEIVTPPVPSVPPELPAFIRK